MALYANGISLIWKSIHNHIQHDLILSLFLLLMFDTYTNDSQVGCSIKA